VPERGLDVGEMSEKMEVSTMTSEGERIRHRRKKHKRVEYLRHIKSERGCRYCGECDPEKLEFHHIDPSKKVGSVVDLYRGSVAKGTTEMEKCEVVCIACHDFIHSGRSGKLKTLQPLRL
jgi:hypothetical protein